MITMNNTRIKNLLVILLIFFSGVKLNAQNDYKIIFKTLPVYDDTSKVSIQFDLLDLENKRVTNYNDVNEVQLRNIVQGELKRKNLMDPRFVKKAGSFQRIPEVGGAGVGNRSLQAGNLYAGDLTVSVLVDRSGSMTQSKMDKVNEVLEDLLKRMPEGSVFISTFHNDITKTMPYNFQEFQNRKIPIAEQPSQYHTALYNAIYSKLLEFDSTAVNNIPNLNNGLEPLYDFVEPLYERKTPLNFLIVLTDGRDESEKIKKYNDPSFEKIEKDILLNKIADYSTDKNRVNIMMIGIKDDQDQYYDPVFLSNVCTFNNNPDYFREGGEEELPNIFVEVANDITPDYYLEMVYPPGTKFTGMQRLVQVTITFPDGKRAQGEFEFVKGSKADPALVDPPEIYEVLLKGLLIGLLFLLVIIILIQIVVPLFRSMFFKMTYVKNYRPDSDTEKQSCTWCKEEIKPGEKAVFRCDHISHWDCWKTNGHKCPNHPDMCEHGKQDYFDINDPLARNESDSVVKQNKKRFTKWIVSGILAGILTWLSYHALLGAKLFDGLIKSLVPAGTENISNYIEKFSPLLLLGTLLGFFLSLFFLYIEEFRRVNAMIALRLLLRSIVGGILGFLVFLLGSALLINFGVYVTSLVDILPWLLFGPFMGVYLSYKTTLSASHGVLGGLFSILFSFITLYLFNSFNEEYTLVLSFVIYGAGLGAAISTIRQMAEKYFLVLNNAPVKNKEFPLHKWISKSADYGVFSIGKGNKSIIKMDWEKGKNVSEDIHAAIYLEKSNKDYPVIVIRDTQNKTYLNDHMLMRPEKEYLLHNGDTFKIGETIFKYEERQKN